MSLITKSLFNSYFEKSNFKRKELQIKHRENTEKVSCALGIRIKLCKSPAYSPTAKKQKQDGKDRQDSRSVEAPKAKRI